MFNREWRIPQHRCDLGPPKAPQLVRSWPAAEDAVKIRPDLFSKARTGGEKDLSRRVTPRERGHDRSHVRPTVSVVDDYNERSGAAELGDHVVLEELAIGH